MPAFRPTGSRGLTNEQINPGDTLILGESSSAGANTTVGAATLTAAQLTAGVIFRSGSAAGYTDTFDNSSNILLALTGNNPGPALVPGSSFKVRIVNTVAYTETLTLGTGMVAGAGTTGSIAASSWRDFLFTFTNVQPAETVTVNLTNGSPTATFVLQQGQTALQIGPALTATNIIPGATILAAAGVPANTTVLGVTQGQGGVVSLTMSQNASATVAGLNLNLYPTIKVDSLGSGTL